MVKEETRSKSSNMYLQVGEYREGAEKGSQTGEAGTADSRSVQDLQAAAP